ncbi:SEL1-like repeat protein [Legionella yabuuchiae]|uniref:SEL1-like repeat protein n=1 Tax=Legionella yabuuchiae TaxID=376727 RepID=UPI0010563AFC|nr:SEL1-like repeat protein [Legionella yabuuchiae]
MITQSDLKTKSRLELLAILVDDMIKGNIGQHDLLCSLFQVCSLTHEATQAITTVEPLKQYCELQIKKNDNHALFLLAWMNHSGVGVPRNHSQAIALYEKAIILNHTGAMNHRALMHIKGLGGKINFAKAIALYEQAIIFNDTAAMNNLAGIYKDLGGEVNYLKAIELYKKAIKLGGDTAAMNNLAIMYLNGLGGEVTHAEAISLFEQAIAFCNTGAMINRARMHKEGLGGEANPPAAISLYELAILLGDKEAMTNRARMHEQGLCGEKNYAQAIALYEQAIALGDKEAMIYRAKMLENGLGCKIKLTQAARLYRKAAEMGLDAALHDLNRPDNNIFYYHYLMSQKMVSEALVLVMKDLSLLKELLEVDCSTENHLNHLKALLKRYDQSRLPPEQLNELYYSVFIAIDALELMPGALMDEFVLLKAAYLPKLKIDSFHPNYFQTIMQWVVHTWYLTEGFTDDAATLLSQLMHKYALLPSFEPAQDLLKNTALILIKKICGEGHDLTMSAVTSEQVMSLVDCYKRQLSFSAEKINEQLRAVLVVKSKDNTPAAIVSPSSSFSLFSTQNSKRENTKTQARPMGELRKMR